MKRIRYVGHLFFTSIVGPNGLINPTFLMLSCFISAMKEQIDLLRDQRVYTKRRKLNLSERKWLREDTVVRCRIN